MGKTAQNQDITIRGRIINVPHSTQPTHPPRHQPDTPRTKKSTKIKPDHQVPTQDSSPPVTDPQPTPAAPPVPPPDEPTTDSPD